MSSLWGRVLINYPYFMAAILFVIGVVTVLTRSNLFKKLLGINIMESAIYLTFVAVSNRRDGVVPILDLANPEQPYINPLPSALMLTGIVVSVSVTAFALALIVRLYRSYHTTDARQISRMKDEVTNG